MSDFFKKVKKEGVPTAITVKDEGTMFAGKVREADDEFVLLQTFSPSGHFDGFACVRIEEIARADISTQYLKALDKVFAYYNEPIPTIKISSRDVLASFIQAAIKEKWLCTVEIGFETLEKVTGYFLDCDFEKVQMGLCDAIGHRDGYTTFDYEEIVLVSALGEKELFMETVLLLTMAEIDDGAPEKKVDGQKEFRDKRNRKADKKGRPEAENTEETEKQSPKNRVIVFPKKDD